MKKKPSIDLHKPSTHDVLVCLSDAPVWASKLLGQNKVYDCFLQNLLQHNFFMVDGERTTIKKISVQTEIKPDLVNKWLRKIYDDIFDLNYEQPELFRKSGVKHKLHFRYTFGEAAWLNVWLEATPAVHETFHCYFVKAKVGTDRFWVKEVSHDIEDGEQEIDVYLEGGFVNRYREWLLDKARFEGYLSFYELYSLKDYQIDEQLWEFSRRGDNAQVLSEVD
ncbi:MAG: hypothetical protein EOP48_06785 [Sphingobacteriales bacterium]|nr:MAG: hypothetical protein EOP48_06785 [Sphingobacteriales bacterium]